VIDTAADDGLTKMTTTVDKLIVQLVNGGRTVQQEFKRAVQEEAKTILDADFGYANRDC